MGGSHTTLGDGALDFRVRHGNGYDSASMATGPKSFGPGLDLGTKGNRDAPGRAAPPNRLASSEVEEKMK